MQYRNIDKQALKENSYTVLSKITIVGTDTVFTEDDHIVDWTYEDYRYVPNNGFIGQFVERLFDGNLQDISEDINLEDTEINLQIGIVHNLDNTSILTENSNLLLTENSQNLILERNYPTTTWYDYGNFLVTKVEKTDTTGEYKFESADYTKKFNKVFDGDYTDTTYTKSFNERLNDEETVTALWLAQYVCKQAGVVLNDTNFTNYNFVISSNQYDSDDTLRKVMQDIGKLAYSWVRVGEDNKVHIDFTPKATSSVDQYDELTTDEYYVSKKSDLTFGPVNKVLIGMSDVEGENLYVTSPDYTEETECAIKIYDNNLTNTEELRQIALNGASRLFGLTYTPVEINSIGHPWLDGDELIKLTNVDDVELYTYPFNRKLTYAGYIEGTIGAEAQTTQESKYEYKSDIISNVRKTSFIVDKQNQTITGLVENVNDNTSSISTLQQSVTGISATVETLDDTVQDVTERVNSVLDTDNTVKGNPVNVEDCGEFLIRNIAFYGNLEQDGTPTPDNPVDIDCVEGEHTLSISSKNKLQFTDDIEDMYNGCIIEIKDNIVTINGTASGYNDVELGNYFSLPKGTYTLSYLIEGESNESEVIQERNSTSLTFRKGTSTLKIFYRVGVNKNDSYTFTLDSTSTVFFRFMTSRDVTYNNFKIKIQIEKGEEVTNYSNVYVTPQEFTYDLGILQLYKIGDNYDYISYNLTDEKWYITRKIDKLSLYDIYNYGAGLEIKSDSQNTAFIKYPFSTYSQNDDDVYSEYLQYKGDLKTELEGLADLALSRGVGLYKSYPNPTNRYIIIVVPNEIATTRSTLLTWLQNNNITMYYSLEQSTTEELQDYDLVEQLNAILNEGKLYETNMIVEDVANDTGTTGDIEVNYLTNAQFNGLYASRAELKITQNSIESTVSETFTTSVQPVIDSVDALGEQLQNTEANLQSNIDDVSNSLSNYALNSSLVTVTNTVSNIQTALNQQILVSKELQENGVSKVTTTTGFTFDENGLAITKTGADTRTVIDEDGMTVYSATGSSETPLLNVDSQGVETENLHVRTYTQIGNHSRLQDYEDGTAIFYIA